MALKMVDKVQSPPEVPPPALPVRPPEPSAPPALAEAAIEKSNHGRSTHEWINSIVAVIALAVSSASAVFSWESIQMKKEALTLSARLDGDCATEYIAMANAGALGICWAITLGNTSEDRLSITDERVLALEPESSDEFGGFRNLETLDGRPLSLPLNLDGGEAVQIIVRIPFMLAPAVAKAVSQVLQAQNGTRSKLSISALENELALQKLDVADNGLEPYIQNGQVLGWTVLPPLKTLVGLFQVTTGRGNNFDLRVVYPLQAN